MAKSHNLGYPRIGAQRELKTALEGYWHGAHDLAQLVQTGAALRARHWQAQAQLDWVPVGDFSFYDGVLDHSVDLGNLPIRVRDDASDPLDIQFRLARGRTAPSAAGAAAVATAEMTKWFDTNYHYLVPEFDATTTFQLDFRRLATQLDEAQAQNVRAKPVILGPVTYLWLGKSKDGSNRLDLLERLLPVYDAWLRALARQGATWVQIDEPILATDLDEAWSQALRVAYHHLHRSGPRLLLASYFGPLADNRYLAATLPVQGLHIDVVRGRDDLAPLLNLWSPHKVLSLGVVDGRNIWRTDLDAWLDVLEPIHARLGDQLWLAPSCSLLHVPVDLASETELDPEVRPWLAFARQKLDEVVLLTRALNEGRAAVADALQDQAAALQARRCAPRVRRADVRAALAALPADAGARRSDYPTRRACQAQARPLPAFPTTTIGSFPQTQAIRQCRQAWRTGNLSDADYQSAMCAEIARTIREQEALGLDVLVHGEAERNDMVEYFGEQLEGYVFTRYGWVQSYGSRCVKPPILVGDVRRREAMTVAWTLEAQRHTDKPVKGMLTGPVTLLNWSFVRDDQPRADTCRQLALALRDEVLALEAAGVGIIQIDEAALREGLPLRQADRADYLAWAVAAFRLAANGVRDDTQIHTHMCYSEFQDILPAIAALDADVITIETARSDMELLDAFEAFAYPNAIGPGVYDIHTPNTPTVAQIVALMQRAARAIPPERLWVNPDCGLKTRHWDEVRPALANLVAAAQILRQHYGESAAVAPAPVHCEA